MGDLKDEVRSEQKGRKTVKVGRKGGTQQAYGRVDVEELSSDGHVNLRFAQGRHGSRPILISHNLELHPHLLL